MNTCGAVRTYHKKRCNNYLCDCKEINGLQLKEEYFQNAGKIEGVYKKYHHNGQLYSEVNYINGLKNGIYKEYYANGQIKEECNYIDDKK